MNELCSPVFYTSFKGTPSPNEHNNGDDDSLNSH